MFLAIKEMKFSKFRYFLIIGIMILISYLTFILSGLASGLSDQFKQEVDEWHASEIVLSEDSNKVFAASQLQRGDLDKVDASIKAVLGVYSGAIEKGDQKLNVSVFGADNSSFFLPEIKEGKNYAKDNEIIISQNLADKGFEVGDKVSIGNYDQKLEIVGISKKSYYAVTPVIYTSLDTWTSIKFGKQPFEDEASKPINAILSKGEVKKVDKGSTQLVNLTIADFIQNIPGYSAQSLTLKSMIYFLFVIVSAVIGIFMYVMTLQKTAIFGVMKAQGVSNSFIAKSILWQSALVAIIGVAIGFVFSYVTSLFLPEAMPFAIDLKQWLLYSMVLILVSVVGGLFSVRTVSKVDAIKAIG